MPDAMRIKAPSFEKLNELAREREMQDHLDKINTRPRTRLPHEVELPRIASLAELLGERYTDAIREKFPDVTPPVYPTGINILVQLFLPGRHKTLANGVKLWMPDETVTGQQARTQTALVRALGPTAYRHRQTLAPWPEGDWCVPGMFIRTPMYGGDRIQVPLDPNNTEGDFTLFVLFRDQDCLGIVTGDPLTIKTS
jgi:hypothetical protein